MARQVVDALSADASRSRLSEADPWTTAILGDELDAGGLEGLLDSFDRPVTKILACLQPNDCARGDLRR